MNYKLKTRLLTLLWLIAVLLALLVSIRQVQGQGTLVLTLACWERPEPGAAGNMYIDVSYSGAPSTWGGSGLSWSYNLPEGKLTAGEYPRAIVASVDGVYSHNIIQLWTDDPYYYADVEFSIDTEAPECSELDAGKYGADGGWFEVTVYDPPCDLCNWQISDEYGNWHDINAQTPVQVEDGKRFTRLVLGNDNSVHDSGRYRVQ